MKTLQEELGWDNEKYTETRNKIEEICLLNKGCPLKEFPELCGYFRLLMKGVFESEQR